MAPLKESTGGCVLLAYAAVASTGGQLMPPVMGAAAFVMAEFLAVPYAQVALWAAIPALLYYIALFFAVHFDAKRFKLAGVPKSELPRFFAVMGVRGHLFVPIFVVLFGLMLGYSAPLCALTGALACIPMALLRGSTRAGIGWRNVFDALVDGARNTLSVAMACACAGIVIGCVTITGLGITFTQFVIVLAQNSLILALALLVPALIKMGAIAPAAHMFAFYFAILSAITPPVALAVFAAAGLAKSDLWSTGWQSVRIAAATYIVPFMFVYEPSIMMIGDWLTIVTSTTSAVVGVMCLAAGLQGYLLRVATWWERIVLVIAAFLLIKPGYISDAIGVVLLAIVLLAQRLPVRAAAK